VANLKEAGIAHVVFPRLCRIKTLKWARGWPYGASVPVTSGGWPSSDELPAVTTRGEGASPVAGLVSLGGGEGQESIGSGGC
jgi:hypothetical protein